MITRTKTPQLHLLPIFNLFRIAIPPLHWYFRIRIRIHQHIERAIPIQLRQESHARRNLPKYTLYFRLYLFLGFFCRRSRRGFFWGGVLLVCGFGGVGFLGGFIEDLYVKLPALDMLAPFFRGDYDD